MDESKYALEWYKYGLNHKDDDVVKFIMHWIAFNWMYVKCQCGSEKNNISAFCSINRNKLNRFDAFSTEAYKVFEKSLSTEAKRQKLSSGTKASARTRDGRKQGN